MDELDEFKNKFIKGYIDPYLDRLLDLRNIIKSATTYDEISEALAKEKKAVQEVISELNGRRN